MIRSALRTAARWAVVAVCGLVAVWALCVLVYLALVVFVFWAVVALIRGALQ